MTTRLTLPLVFAFGLAVVSADGALAQSMTRGGSTSGRGTSATGMFGNRTLGGGIQSNAQQQAATQVGNGQAVEQMQEGAGAVSGDERFLRENRQPGAFVGADTGDAVNLRSQMQGQVQQQNFGNLFQNLFGNANIQNQNPRTQLRIPIKLGFAPRPIPTTQVAVTFTARLTRLPEFHATGPIEVTMEGRTAVLRGKVASEADRQLAEDLAMLEPAVRAVRNELVVDPAATTEEVPLPAATGLPATGLP